MKHIFVVAKLQNGFARAASIESLFFKVDCTQSITQLPLIIFLADRSPLGLPVVFLEQQRHKVDPKHLPTVSLQLKSSNRRPAVESLPKNVRLQLLNNILFRQKSFAQYTT